MNHRVRFANGVEIDLEVREERLLGWGNVKVGGTMLRSPERPMGMEIRNPNGVLVHDYRVVLSEESEKQVRIQCSMTQASSGPMEFMLHTVRNRYNTTDWTKGPEPLTGSFELILRPVTRQMGKTVYQGFSYKYVYRSDDLPIYKILDRGTWEVDGHAVGNEFWMRNGTVPSIVKVEGVEDIYSTEWYLPTIHQPNIFQFFPLQTNLQGFSFTAHDKGILVTWPTKVAHVRSLFEKTSGSDLLVHWHEHCGDLSGVFETSPVEVLWHPAPKTSHVERLNLYEEVRDTVWTELHREIGMRQERVQPYGVMEEWTVPDMEAYRTQGVPKLCDAGAKAIMIPSFFQNNMNVWGVSNMCCTVDLKVADAVGEKALADLCSEARKHGAFIEMWGNTSLSSLVDIFSRRNGHSDRIKFLPHEGSGIEEISREGDPWVRNLSGAVEADHYTPVFMVMNLRNQAVRDYWMKCWKYAHLNVGLEGVFIDSSFNLSSDKFHFLQNAGGHAGGATIDQTHLLGATRPPQPPRQKVLSQYRAYLDLMVEMQAAGYTFAGEDVGVFGIGRSGPGVSMRMPSLPLWCETVCVFNAHEIKDHGSDPDHVYFAGLAYRLMWYLFWNPRRDALTFAQEGPHGEQDKPREFHTTLLKAFAKASPVMFNRHIEETEKWVRYEKDGVQCYWALEDAVVSLPKSKNCEDLITGNAHLSAKLEMARHHVYLVS